MNINYSKNILTASAVLFISLATVSSMSVAKKIDKMFDSRHVDMGGTEFGYKGFDHNSLYVAEPHTSATAKMSQKF